LLFDPHVPPQEFVLAGVGVGVGFGVGVGDATTTATVTVLAGDTGIAAISTASDLRVIRVWRASNSTVNELEVVVFTEATVTGVAVLKPSVLIKTHDTST
jgi:hypothetical protein